MVTAMQTCPVCAEKNGVKRKLKSFHINLNETIFMCSDKMCVYPIGSNDASSFMERLNPSINGTLKADTFIANNQSDVFDKSVSNSNSSPALDNTKLSVTVTEKKSPLTAPINAAKCLNTKYSMQSALKPFPTDLINSRDFVPQSHVSSPNSHSICQTISSPSSNVIVSISDAVNISKNTGLALSVTQNGFTHNSNRVVFSTRIHNPGLQNSPASVINQNSKPQLPVISLQVPYSDKLSLPKSTLNEAPPFNSVSHVSVQNVSSGFTVDCNVLTNTTISQNRLLQRSNGITLMTPTLVSSSMVDVKNSPKFNNSEPQLVNQPQTSCSLSNSFSIKRSSFNLAAAISMRNANSADAVSKRKQPNNRKYLSKKDGKLSLPTPVSESLIDISAKSESLQLHPIIREINKSPESAAEELTVTSSVSMNGLSFSTVYSVSNQDATQTDLLNTSMTAAKIKKTLVLSSIGNFDDSSSKKPETVKRPRKNSQQIFASPTRKKSNRSQRGSPSKRARLSINRKLMWNTVKSDSFEGYVSKCSPTLLHGTNEKLNEDNSFKKSVQFMLSAESGKFSSSKNSPNVSKLKPAIKKHVFSDSPTSVKRSPVYRELCATLGVQNATHSHPQTFSKLLLNSQPNTTACSPYPRPAKRASLPLSSSHITSHSHSPAPSSIGTASSLGSTHSVHQHTSKASSQPSSSIYNHQSSTNAQTSEIPFSELDDIFNELSNSVDAKEVSQLGDFPLDFDESLFSL